MARFVFGLALAIQVGGVALAALGELRHRAWVSRAGTAALGAAWLLEAAAIVTTGIAAGAFPLRNGPEYMLMLGFLVLTLHLALGSMSRVSAAVYVLPPVSALMLLVGLLLQTRRTQGAAFPEPGWFVFHTAVATLGVASLAVAFSMSVLFLVKERALKEKRSLAMLERLPAVETLDRLGFQALLFGFPLLTLGIATGMVYSSELHDRLWSWGLKEIFPVLAWLVFAAILWARLAKGLTGRRSAILAIAGFALALLTFVGMTRG
jgi:ABC-type transport system involved in cytochrome c biogenesis permease subunit